LNQCYVLKFSIACFSLFLGSNWFNFFCLT